MMNVHTPNAQEYWADVGGRTSMVFKVKACQDATIKLSKRFGLVDGSTYEVRIGAENNQKTIIIPDPESSHQESADTPNVLDCNQYKPFWLAWKYGTLYVGQGSFVWEDELLRYDVPTPHDVQGAMMETLSGTEGVFSVSRLDGKHLF